MSVEKSHGLSRDHSHTSSITTMAADLIIAGRDRGKSVSQLSMLSNMRGGCSHKHNTPQPLRFVIYGRGLNTT